VYVSEIDSTGFKTKIPIPYHTCNEEDISRFSSSKNGQEKIMSYLKSQTELYCLDRLDQFGNPIDLSIYGAHRYNVKREISIVYRPCIPT
jgi:hypothetical protein